ncbi:MAG: hypothetical protein AAFY33_07035 [Cyanobacteria bacterium J06643_4]
MKRVTLAGVFWFVLAIASPSLAQTITPNQQQHPQTTVALHRGQGVTLNFRPTGETIQRAWLDDPSQTTLDFDDANCAATDAAASCAASVIHLRRINPIDFPGLPSTGVTSLTVLTDNNLYSFRLTFPENGSPSYAILNIEPEREISPNTPSIIPQLTRTEGIAVIEQGLEVARSRGLIDVNDPLWQRTQTFLSLMREGTPDDAAANRAGVSQSLIVHLTELGQTNTTLAI